MDIYLEGARNSSTSGERYSVFEWARPTIPGMNELACLREEKAVADRPRSMRIVGSVRYGNLAPAFEWAIQYHDAMMICGDFTTALGWPQGKTEDAIRALSASKIAWRPHCSSALPD